MAFLLMNLHRQFIFLKTSHTTATISLPVIRLLFLAALHRRWHTLSVAFVAQRH